jgi:DNA-binding HxlR family transcriptional regulator
MTRHHGIAATTASAGTSEQVTAALARIGPCTAAQLATDLGIAYSTLTAKLRRLETDGHVHRSHPTPHSATHWHLTTPAIHAAAAETPDARTPHGDPSPVDTAADTATTHETESATPTGSDAPTEPADASATITADTRTPGSTTHPPSIDAPIRPVRRRNGSIAADILAVMRADPDATFKVSHLSTALPGTSAGAIANSLHKLVIDGSITQVCEKPSTYQAA